MLTRAKLNSFMSRIKNFSFETEEYHNKDLWQSTRFNPVQLQLV